MMRTYIFMLVHVFNKFIIKHPFYELQNCPKNWELQNYPKNRLTLLKTSLFYFLYSHTRNLNMKAYPKYTQKLKTYLKIFLF